jgi:hypothetical protein
MTDNEQVRWWQEAMGHRRPPGFVVLGLAFTVGRCTVTAEAPNWSRKPFTFDMRPFKGLLTGKSPKAKRDPFARCPKYVALPGPGSVETRVTRAWHSALDTGRWAG